MGDLRYRRKLEIIVTYSTITLFCSGESGAGKTVSANHVVNFITKAAGKGSDKVEVGCFIF